MAGESASSEMSLYQFASACIAIKGKVDHCLLRILSFLSPVSYFFLCFDASAMHPEHILCPLAHGMGRLRIPLAVKIWHFVA